IFDVTGDLAVLEASLAEYMQGRTALAAVVAASEGVYGANLAFGYRPSEQGHWADRLRQVDTDISALSQELDEQRGAGASGDSSLLIARRSTRLRSGDIVHAPVDAFENGKPLVIEARTTPGLEIDVHVRHLNQGEEWIVLPM